MKILHFIIVLVLGISWLKAQETKPHFLLCEVYNRIGFSMLQLRDPYLSILDYSGLGVRADFQSTRLFHANNRNLSHTTKLSGLGAVTTNPMSTAGVYYLGTTASWGMHYHFRPSTMAMLRVGGNLEGEFAYKLNSRNVNNQVNLDVASHLNFSVLGKFFITTKRRVITLNTEWETPIIGLMMVMPQGKSYWELSKTSDFSSLIHMSGLTNRQAFRQSYWIDIPLRFFTWSTGFRASNLKFQANNQIYSKREFSLFLGITYDVIQFSGRKELPPATLISPRY